MHVFRSNSGSSWQPPEQQSCYHNRRLFFFQSSVIKTQSEIPYVEPPLGVLKRTPAPTPAHTGVPIPSHKSSSCSWLLHLPSDYATAVALWPWIQEGPIHHPHRHIYFPGEKWEPPEWKPESGLQIEGRGGSCCWMLLSKKNLERGTQGHYPVNQIYTWDITPYERQFRMIPCQRIICLPLWRNCI